MFAVEDQASLEKTELPFITNKGYLKKKIVVRTLLISSFKKKNHCSLHKSNYNFFFVPVVLKTLK